MVIIMILIPGCPMVSYLQRDSERYIYPPYGNFMAKVGLPTRNILLDLL